MDFDYASSLALKQCNLMQKIQKYWFISSNFDLIIYVKDVDWFEDSLIIKVNFSINL